MADEETTKTTETGLEIENPRYTGALSYLVYAKGKRMDAKLRVRQPAEAAKSGTLSDGREFRANWNNPSQAELDLVNEAIRAGDAELQAHDTVADGLRGATLD